VAVDLVKELNGHGIDATLLFVYGSRGNLSSELGPQCAYLGRERNEGTFGNILALRRWIAGKRPDLIHHHDGLAWTHLASLSTRIPIVGHGHLFATARRPTFKTRLANFIHRAAYGRLFAVGQGVADSWAQMGFPNGRIEVVPNGINTARFRPPTEEERREARDRLGISSSHKTILFVGRLDIAMKGCDDFLRIVAKLPSDYKGRMVGTGPDLQALKNLAVQLKIADRVDFVGHQADTRTYYWAADAFLLTSRYEPFGLVLLEAVACGLPAVVLPCEGDAPAIAGRIGARLACERNIDEAAAFLMEEVIGDSRDSQIERHKQCAELFSVQFCALSVMREYASMLSHA
jgi:glycosyltransferase involved in cell wall biosynthesis